MMQSLTYLTRTARRRCHVQLFSSMPATSTEMLEAQILEAARTKQTGVSLQTLLQFGQLTQNAKRQALIGSAQFLKRELPIRFAHRIVELEALPHGLSNNAHVKKIADWYRQSFEELRSFPLPKSSEDEDQFTKLLASIYERHNPTLVTMARALYTYRQGLNLATGEPFPEAIAEDVYSFLDVFFTSRLGIRTLISQHVALHENRPHYCGVINTACRPREVVEDAVADARLMCERNYGDCPDVKIVGADGFTFAYIPMYIHHIIFELMKNSMRAVVETHGSSGSLPTVKVILSAAADSEDVVIKISDEGGGIPRSGMNQIFSYFFTTAKAAFKDEGEGDDGADFSTATPMAGLGFGLPLSRVFARYFGGDLQVISMEGYGTDAYLYLRRLGDASEPISECAFVSAFAPSLASAGVSSSNFATSGRLQPPRVDDLHPPPQKQPHASFRVSLKNVTYKK